MSCVLTEFQWVICMPLGTQCTRQLSNGCGILLTYCEHIPHNKTSHLQLGKVHNTLLTLVNLLCSWGPDTGMQSPAQPQSDLVLRARTWPWPVSCIAVAIFWDTSICHLQTAHADKRGFVSWLAACEVRTWLCATLIFPFFVPTCHSGADSKWIKRKERCFSF